MSQPPFTKGPWTVCWQTYNGRRCNFHITASPYGSVRPLARTDWKIEWSEVEGEELVANGNLMGAAPDLYEVVRAVFGREGFFQVDEKIAAKARAALAKAEGR
jgi:hypothetical protein